MLCNLICIFELKSYAKERFIELNFETVTSKKLLKSKLINIFEFLNIEKIDLNLKIIDKNKKYKWKKQSSLSPEISNAYEAFKEMTLINEISSLNK